jgi:membrane-bound serine protease (ClpP class)
MTALGVSLLSVGAIVILIEAHYPTFGALGGPGVVMLVAGSVLAVAGLGGGVLLAALSALVLGGTGAATLWLSVRKGMATRRRRIRTGREGMIGHVGVVRSWTNGAGSVLVDGALWRARCEHGDESDRELNEGDPVVVEYLSGLTLSVRPAEQWELMA